MYTLKHSTMPPKKLKVPDLPTKTFEEAYGIYVQGFKPFDNTIPSKSPDEMKTLVDGDRDKEKWNRIKVFLMAYKYKSWGDIFLLIERVYRSCVNNSGLSQKRTSNYRKKVFCSKKCGFFVMTERSNDDIWWVTEVGDLCLHSVDCFKVAAKNSAEFTTYVREKWHDLDTDQLSDKIMKTFNCIYNAHSFHQIKCDYKKVEERTLRAEKREVFDEEVFRKLFSLGNDVDLTSYGEDMSTIFGMLTEFKDEDPGFIFKCNHSDDTLNFLGLLWSSQKELLKLYGDFLIVDSVHGFCNACYHVINVVIVDNNLKSRFGAIAITRNDCCEAYKAIFKLIKDNVGDFKRPPKAILADGAIYIHNAFDEIFPGGKHVFCTFHLEKHIKTWFKDCADKVNLNQKMLEGLFATNPIKLGEAVDYIKGHCADLDRNTYQKVLGYLSNQPPCKQNFFTAGSTASGRCEERNRMLRRYGFKKSGGLIRVITRFKDVVNCQYDDYKRDSLVTMEVPQIFATIVDQSFQSLYTESLYKSLQKQFVLAHKWDPTTKNFDLTQKGYDVTLTSDGIDKTYSVICKGDGYSPYVVSWPANDSGPEASGPRCSCSINFNQGHPCRHIISVCFTMGKKLTNASINNRFERDQGSFLGSNRGQHNSEDNSQIDPGPNNSGQMPVPPHFGGGADDSESGGIPMSPSDLGDEISLGTKQDHIISHNKINIYIAKSNGSFQDDKEHTKLIYNNLTEIIDQERLKILANFMTSMIKDIDPKFIPKRPGRPREKYYSEYPPNKKVKH